MRIVLPSPPSDVEITASTLEPLPPVVTSDVLEQRCRAHLRGEVERVGPANTALGWPCFVLRSRCADSYVVRAYICFLDHGVLVEARANDADACDRAWSVVAQARPDWSGDLVALGQLFSA